MKKDEFIFYLNIFIKRWNIKEKNKNTKKNLNDTLVLFYCFNSD